MSEIEARGASAPPIDRSPAGGPTQDALRGQGPNLRVFASAGLRSVVLIVIVGLLILIVLPGALVAAGT